MRGPRSRALRPSALLALALLAAAPEALAAPPQVPASLSYQGVLLEPSGQPRSGAVDLTIRIFDDLAAGTLIYQQTFAAVPLVDGVFHVVLGPTGAASDPPLGTPLTTSLAAALAGDVGATGPDRFLEVTVGSEGPLGRTQVLATAYALRAGHAASADTAALVNVADTAIDTDQVGGLSSEYLTEMWEHMNADGGGPANTDPLEGLGDVDGDGIANFVDPDNDGDTRPDVTEVASGGVNLVTPTVSGVTPPAAFSRTTSDVTLDGVGFLPGLTVQFGSQTFAPSTVTWTSIPLTVGPQISGTKSVTVTLPNGQSHTFNGFQFAFETIAHGVALGQMVAALQVRPGTEELALRGAGEYGVGQVLQQEEPLAGNGRIAVAWDGDVLTGARCRVLSTTSCVLEYLRDGDGDRQLEDEVGTPIETLSSATATPMPVAIELLHDASGRAVVAYKKVVAPASAMLARDLDGDGDFDGAGERTTVEANIGGLAFEPLALALDSAGRVAFVYQTAGVGLRVRWDRNGDGDFEDTVGGNPETVTYPIPTSFVGCAGAAFDSSDRLAVVFGEPFQVRTRLLRDVTADGDFLDAGEETQLTTASGSACDVAGRAGQPLAATYLNSGVQLRWDADGDNVFEGSDSFSTSSSVTSLATVVTDLGTILVAADGSLFFSPP